MALDMNRPVRMVHTSTIYRILCNAIRKWDNFLLLCKKIMKKWGRDGGGGKGDRVGVLIIMMTLKSFIILMIDMTRNRNKVIQ